MDPLVLAALLSLLIGGSLGLLGGGGGILAVPVLVYVVGLGPKPAIATSLLMVGATSLVGAAIHARSGRVRWRLGVVFGAASMSGAFVGGRLARFVPERGLLLGLALVMLATGIAMLRGPSSRAGAELAPARMLAIGAAVGLVSGMVGAGGGFLIVPALTIFGGLAMEEAIATSLFVVALQSFAGLAGHAGHVMLDGRLLAAILGSALVGTIAGVALGRRIAAAGLKRAFAGLVLGTGLFVLARQLSLVWMPVFVVPIVGAALSLRRDRAAPSSPSTTETECIHSAPLQP